HDLRIGVRRPRSHQHSLAERHRRSLSHRPCCPPMEVQVGPAVVTIHADDEVVVCEPNLKMSSTKEQGYFSRDSRFVSGYRIKLGRAEPVLLNSSAVRSYSARFEFTNAEVVTSGGRIPAQTIHMRVDRRVGHGVHDDYDIVNHGRYRSAIGFDV